MPTLYVENVPASLYDALRARAKANRRSIAAEVLTVLTESIPTEEELARRRELLNVARKIRARRSPGTGPFPSTEVMQRENRSR